MISVIKHVNIAQNSTSPTNVWSECHENESFEKKKIREIPLV